MAKRMIRLESDIENQEGDQATRSRKRPVRRSRWKRWGIVLGMFGLMGVFLPQLLSFTPLGDWALQKLVPAQYGQLTVGRRSLAWWAPISAGDVRLLDPQGELLAEVGQITTQQTLWEIVRSGQLQRMDIDQGAARVVWRADGSNWEDYVFALLETMPSTGSTATPDMEIHLSNCQAYLESLTDDQRWMAVEVQGLVTVKRNGNDIRIQTEASLLDARQNLAAGEVDSVVVVGDQQALQEFAEQSQIQCAGEGFQKGTGEGGVAFTVRANEVATSAGRSIARRYLPTLELNGLATGKVAGVANYWGDYVFLQTPKVVLERVGFGDEDYLYGDLIQQNRVDVVGAFEMNPTGFVFHDTRLSGDFGRVDIDGVADLQKLNDIVQSRRLPVETLSTSGDINLGQVANQLRNTLQLRDGLRLNSGNLNWEIHNRRENDGSLRLLMDVVAKNLSGQLDQETLSWNEPIKIRTSLRDNNRPVFIEDLNVESHFLTANVRPRAEGGGQIQFESDFDRMKAALDQFFQLSPMTMRGRGSGNANWVMQPSAEGQPGLDVEVALNLQNANLILPGVFELRDPNIALRGATRLELGSSATSASLWDSLMQSPDMVVRTGRVELRTGESALQPIQQQNPTELAAAGERLPLGLTAVLNQPIQISRLWTTINRIAGVGAGQPASQQPVVDADLQINGPLENWVAMVRPLLSGTDLALIGDSHSQAKLLVMDSYATLAKLNARATGFGFRGYGTILQEDRVQVEGALSYHYDAGLLHLGDVTLSTSTAAIRATQTRFRWAGNRPVLSGDLYYRIDVARLYQTLNRLYVASDDPGFQLGQLPFDPKSLPLMKPDVAATDVIEQVTYLEPAAASSPMATSVGDLQIGGELFGSMRLEQSESAETLIHLEGQLNQGWIGAIQANGQPMSYLTEPQMVIKGDAKLSADANQLSFPQLLLQGRRLAADVSGRLEQLMTTPTIQVQAGVNADVLQLLQPLAGESLGDLQIEGLKGHHVQLSGPLDINSLQGSWKSDWQSIAWMGLSGGPANVVLNLSDGILRMEPLRFTAGGGQVNFAPEMDLRGEIVWVRLPQGVVLDQVQLTPKLCRNWLKYAAPLLAEVTSVQGTFSLDSDGIEVPLSNWTSLAAKARVTINGARVGPGPLGFQIGQVISAVKTLSDGGSLDADTLSGMGLGGVAGLANSGNGQRTEALGQLASGLLGNLGEGQKPDMKQLVAGDATANTAATDTEKVWLDIPQQTVALNIADGGVQHEQLKMTMKGFELVSNGRVGLDQTIAVETQLNIPQDVLDKNPDVAYAFGNSLQLPIGGTLTKPTLQSAQLRTALNTAVSRGVQKAVGDQLQKKLGVPGLGELGNGSGNPLDGLIQQGQKKLGEKLNLPSADQFQNLFPGISPSNNNSGSGVPATGEGNSNNPTGGDSAGTNSPSTEAGNPAVKPTAQDLLNQQWNKGLQKIFK